ncbi:MAG: methyltransferase domain-containing protein [Bacteroidota bacterium]
MENSIFKNPNTGTPLLWENEGGTLRDATEGQTWTIDQGCFVLLPETPESGDFAYREHYQADAEVFDYFAGWEDPAAVHENRRLHETILHHQPAQVKRVLDVGCGAAWVAAHFANKGVEVYSMDVSTINPQRAVKNYPFKEHLGVVADVFYLPFQEGAFDLIIASEIIEHVPDPKQFLAQLLPALAPGGKLVVTTPHDEKLAYSLCVHCNQATPHHGHLHSFTAASIRALLPEPLRAGARTQTFVNKLLLHARTHRLLRFFPFQIWRWIDRVFNLILPKTARLLLVVQRGE